MLADQIVNGPPTAESHLPGGRDIRPFEQTVKSNVRPRRTQPRSIATGSFDSQDTCRDG